MGELDVSNANSKIPREAGFDDGIIAALAFVLFLLVLWILLAGFRVHGIYVHDALLREGHDADAEVIKSYTGRGNVAVEYKFFVDGVAYAGRADMIGDDYSVQAPGDRIFIRYLPTNPRINQPVNWRWFSIWELPYYVFGAGLLVGVAILVIMGLRKRKLARFGVVVEGRVIGCAPKRSRFTTYYEFTTKENERVEGSAQTLEEREVGKPFLVLYQKDKPERNDCYPM